MGSLPGLPGHGSILDIGGSTLYHDVGERLSKVLTTPYDPASKPVLPDELLYDDVGLPIWNDIIFTPEFYQTHDEIALFDIHGSEIAKRVQAGVTVVDLALDISKMSLKQNIQHLVKKHGSPGSTVTCAGIWGTFNDGRRYIEHIPGQRLFLSLGSVLCNDPWPEALSHLKYWADALRPNDLLLIGMDGHVLPNNRTKIWNAYHSSDDAYRAFFLNGFKHANRLLGHDCFLEEDWEFLAELEEVPTTRHRFFFRAKRDIELGKLGRTIKKGEEIDWFDSHKYDESRVRLMCYKAGLSVLEIWQAPGSEFRQYLVRRKHDKDQRDDSDSAVSGLS